MSTLKLTGNRCQCAACGEYFTSERSFDKHRTGRFGIDRGCMTGSEMDAAGFARNPRGFRCEPGTRAKPAHFDVAAPRTGAAMQPQGDGS